MSIELPPELRRTPTDLHSAGSFDHVGRDAASSGLVSGAVLAELADQDDRIVAACADLKYVTRMALFEARHPDRFFQFGISEKNMLTAAAGMAACGLIPYVATFACFSAILGYEAIRTDLAYPGLPVRVIATHAGIAMGFFGTSHHATEDIAALRAIAGLTVVSAPDGAGAEALLRATVELPGPIYFRLGRGRERRVYSTPPADYGPGAPPKVIHEGTDVLLVSTGVMVGECLHAAALLQDQHDVSATVLDVHTLKPFPTDAVAAHAARHQVVVTVEEHNIEGGLGTIVRDAIADAGATTPILKHGLQDEFALIGPPTHLYRYYGLDPQGIATVATRAVAQGGVTRGRALWGPADRERVLAAYACGV
jgi:transketolase